MHVISMLGLIFILLGIQAPLASAVTVEELQSLVRELNPSEKDQFTVQLETKGKSKILKIGRKMEINPTRHLVQVQSVHLKYLDPIPVVETIGSSTQPWVKLRCKKNRDEVLVLETVYVEDKVSDMDSTEEYRSLMVIPCDPYDVDRLAQALIDFFSKN